jgi:hypothetical protein
MPDPEDVRIEYIRGAGTVPYQDFSTPFLEAEQDRNPELRILYVPSSMVAVEPICWYRYGKLVFYGTFDALSKVNLKAYVMSR